MYKLTSYLIRFRQIKLSQYCIYNSGDDMDDDERIKHT